MLGYGDKPFGANQFYGNFNSWERTKSWFAGIKQDLGDSTEFDFGLPPPHRRIHPSARRSCRTTKTITAMKAGRPRCAASSRWARTRLSSTAAKDFTSPLTATTWASTSAAAERFTWTTTCERWKPLFVFGRSARGDSSARRAANSAPRSAAGYWLKSRIQAERQRQPRLPPADLHRPLLLRSGDRRQSEPAAGNRLGLRRRTGVGPRRTLPSGSHRLRARENGMASTTCAPRPPTCGTPKTLTC